MLKNEIDDFRKKVLEIPAKIENFDKYTCENIGNDLIKLFEEGFECFQNCNDCLSSILNESIANIAELKRVEDDLTLAREYFAEYIEEAIDKIFKDFINIEIVIGNGRLYTESSYYIFKNICEIYLKKENILLLGEDLFSFSTFYKILEKRRYLDISDKICESASKCLLYMVENNLIKSPETFWKKNSEILLGELNKPEIFTEFIICEDKHVVYEDMILALLKIACLVPNRDEKTMFMFGKKIDSINNSEIKKIFKELYPNYKLEVAVEDLIQSKRENFMSFIESTMEDNFSFLEEICDFIEKDKKLLCKKKTFEKYKNAVLIFLKNANLIFDNSEGDEGILVKSVFINGIRDFDICSTLESAEKIKESILKVKDKIKLFNDPKIVAAYNDTIENLRKNKLLTVKESAFLEGKEVDLGFDLCKTVLNMNIKKYPDLVKEFQNIGDDNFLAESDTSSYDEDISDYNFQDDPNLSEDEEINEEGEETDKKGKETDKKSKETNEKGKGTDFGKAIMMDWEEFSDVEPISLGCKKLPESVRGITGKVKGAIEDIEKQESKPKEQPNPYKSATLEELKRRENTKNIIGRFKGE